MNTTNSAAAALGSGSDFWSTKAIEDVPSIFLTDGPHGLRKQEGNADHLGVAGSVPATCFPPAVSLGQAWDEDLVERIGHALGRECQAADVQVLLGPGINIKRSPLGGRNFEYFSEDPLVSGVMGAAWIRGLQAEGVGASLKHFALNNQESDRMRVSSDVDPRPLREIYLRGFRRAITTAEPWTVMCAYNAVNGVLVSEDPFLLTQVLRNEWGFDGVVVSDWGAVRDRVASVAAGLDLQMPGDAGVSDAQAVAAVDEGALDAAAVERAADRVAELARRALASRRAGATFDALAHHELARQAAARSIVLLQNKNDLLPLGSTIDIAVIGELARTPRFQGGGSSHVSPTRVDIPLDEIRGIAARVAFAPGYTLGAADSASQLLDEAVAAASRSGAAVLFLGLDERDESEGFDRSDIELPQDQLQLLAAVRRVQPNLVVVLSHGGVLRLEAVSSSAAAILDGGLLGQAGGSAIAQVLFGQVNPSGKLNETVPKRLGYTPAFLDFPGEHQHVRYAEGLFVGYRWYDAREIPVTFPFGHGLSYTTFDYGDLTLETDGDDIIARVPVTNTGARRGREVVQAYVSLPTSAQVRAPRSLGGFAGVELEPGEMGEVKIRIERTEVEYWDVRVSRFVLEPGTYRIHVGSSSRDLRVHADIDVRGEQLRMQFSLESTIGEFLGNPEVEDELFDLLRLTPFLPGDSDAAFGTDVARMMSSLPINRLPGFADGEISPAQLDHLVAAANTA